MQIVDKDLNDLKDYDKNARTHDKEQLQELADSIKEFGFNDPIEIDSNNTIISGHARAEAARLAGLTSIPTVCHSHLTDSQKKAYTIAANKIAQKAGWDTNILKNEFIELMDSGCDLALTGFSQKEIDEILQDGIDIDDKENQESTELAQETISKMGDVWILGNHRLMCGDSTNPENVNELYKNHSPILMVTDPPYGVEYDPSWRDGVDIGFGKRSTGKVENDDKVDWSASYSLFTGYIAYVWHAGVYSHAVATNLNDCGFEVVSQIIWVKQHFALSRGDYHWQHEPCWYVVKKGKKHNWQGARDQSTTWEIKNNNSFGNSNPEETLGHGTQKPIECMLRPILNNTKFDDYVYDPFGGSGTTLIACDQSNRKCLMMELSPNYCDMIIKRWQKLTKKQAILESTGEAFDGETR